VHRESVRGKGGEKPCVEQVSVRASQPSLQYNKKKKFNHNGIYVIESYRYFSFEVAVEDKSLQHHPQVCTMNVLEIKFSTWAFIETTLSVPFLKSYKAKTEVAKLIFLFLSSVQFLCIVCPTAILSGNT